MRLMGKMKSGVQAPLIGVLAALLVVSALACPLWMGFHQRCPAPKRAIHNNAR